MEVEPGAINSYSRTWFDTFLTSVPDRVTEAEIAFVQRILPLPEYRSVLDLCCGFGRHTVPLTALGYAVTGVDRDLVCVQRCNERLRGTCSRVICGDMRDLSGLSGPFDAALIMWQSFGYFDADTNLRVLAELAGLVRPGGRLVLDLYHRGFFEEHQGTRTLESTGRSIVETKWMEESRLHVRLEYEDGAVEGMEWQLFYLEEIASAANDVGFDPLLMCCQWSEATPPVAEAPRMQVVLVRRQFGMQDADTLQ